MTGKLLDGATPCNAIFQQFIPHKILAPKRRTLGSLKGSWVNLGSLPIDKSLFTMENFPPGFVFWGCGKWKQNAAHSEKFIYLTGELQIHPSPA